MAVKTVKEDSYQQVSMGIEEFMREAQVMKKMNHPNLVQLVGVCSKELPMYIITEYCSQGDLLSYCRGHPKDINQKASLYICSQIADAMAYLEAMNCIHRDLAARNVLVADKSLVCKVADFGMGRVIDDLYTARMGSKMPVKWSAPESLCYNAFSSASDVWSYGILMWEVVTAGQSPYPDVESKDVLMRLEEGHRMEEPAGTPEGMYDLMFKCWYLRAEERPTFSALKDGLEQLLDAVAGGGAKAKPRAARASVEWRQEYEGSGAAAGGLTRELLQELVDKTKDVYAKASTIMRYGDAATIANALAELLAATKDFLDSVGPVMDKKDIKSTKKKMESPYSSLAKAKGLSLEKAKPNVEKLRAATRDMNKYLKKVTV